MDEKRHCGNCKHFHEAAGIQSNHPLQRTGECRFNPPNLVLRASNIQGGDVSAASMYPPLHAGAASCSHWEAKLV